MKITCPKCTAQYEVKSSLIPPAGVMMRCPACLHTFPVRPGAAPAPAPHDEEFTPPGAQPRHRPAAPRPGPLPSGGVVSPVGPVPRSVHDTSHDAELPVPKPGAPQTVTSGRVAAGRPPESSGRRTEAPDLPAPKRPTGRDKPEAPPARLAAPAPAEGELDLEDLPAPLRPPPGKPRAAEVADLPAPVGKAPRAAGSGPPVAPRLESRPAAVVPPGESRRSVEPRPIPPEPRARVGTGAAGASSAAPAVRSSPAPSLELSLDGGIEGLDLPAPVGPAPRPAPPRSPATKLGLSDPARRDLAPALTPEPEPGRDLRGPAAQTRGLSGPGAGARTGIVDLPTPVKAELPAPVKAELPSPVAPGLPSPVAPGLPSPVPSAGIDLDLDLPPPTSLSQEVSLDDDDLAPPPGGPDVVSAQPGEVPTLDTLAAWPPPPGALRPQPARPDPGAGMAPSLSLDDNSEQITRPLGDLSGPSFPPPGSSGGAPAGDRDGLRDIDERRAATPRAFDRSEPPRPEPLSLGLGLDAPGEMDPAAGEPGEPSGMLDLNLPSRTSPASEDAGGDEAGDGQKPKGKPGKKGKGKGKPAEPLSRRRRIALMAAACAGLLLLVGGGVTGYLLFFKGRRSAEDQVKVDQAVRLLGDDAVPSYRKAADVMRDLSGKNPEDGGALSLEVLARLGLVRYGVVAERRTAEERLQQVPPEQRGGPEAQKAQAVLDLVSGKPAEARRALEGLSRSPAGQRDPLAQVYLGWCDLRLAKYAQAEKDFQAALKLSPRLAGALLGIAQAKDKAGDRKGANAAYLKVRGVMADHFGASVGQILTADDPDSEAKLLDLMSKKGRNAGPRELADLWTLLGLRAREQSRTKDAEERLRRALQADATQGAAQVALAQIFCDKEKYAEATTLAQQAFRADPKNVEAGVVLVRALMSQKKPLDAGAPLLAIAKLAPKDARVLYWQGRREEEVAAQGADGKAAALYQKALEADGKYLDAYIALFRVLNKLGKATDALAALKQAAALAKGDPALATTLGEAYLGAKQPQKAEESFRLALELKPEQHTARMGLSTALEQQGDLEGASRELAELEKRQKTYPGLAERQARLSVLQGRYEEAEAQYLKAAQQPGASQDLRLDAAFYNIKSHTAEAEALTEGVLRDNPRSGRALALMAAVKLQAGVLPEAMVHADMALRVGDFPEAHFVRARALVQQNKGTEALGELIAARKPPVEGAALALHAKLVADSGGSADALNELTELTDRQRVLFADRTYYRPEEVTEILGAAYMQLGDLWTRAQKDDRALRAYEQAVKTWPKSAEAAFRYGKALYGVDKRQPAIKELQRALQLGGEKPPYLLEATLILGDALRESHKKAEALRYYRRWLDLAPPTAPERSEVQNYIYRLGG